MNKSPNKTSGKPAAKATSKASAKEKVPTWPALDKQSLDMKGVVGEIQAVHPELSKAAIEGVLKTYTHLLVDRVAKHGLQRIAGLGAFSVKESPARVGRNLRTGEPIDVPARRAVKFSAAAQFKVAVNAPAR